MTGMKAIKSASSITDLARASNAKLKTPQSILLLVHGMGITADCTILRDVQEYEP